MERKFINKKALILIAVLLFLAVIIYFCIPRRVGKTAEIWVDGKLFKSFDLSENFEISLENGVTIKGDTKSAYFTHSDCPDKLCIGTGKLSLDGQWAACLPNSTVLKIKGEEAIADMVN